MLVLYDIFKYGGSSLLFIISAIQALFTSKLLAWKLSNSIIIISSYLYNTYDCKACRNFDYLIISAISMSYINNLNINILFGLCFFIEMILKQQITITKNIVFLLACGLSLFNTFYVDYCLFIYLLLVIVIGIIAIQYRNLSYYSTGYTPFVCFLTTIWHVCAGSILFVSSYTAL
jgi:hypothetical protein